MPRLMTMLYNGNDNNYIHLDGWFYQWKNTRKEKMEINDEFIYIQNHRKTHRPGTGKHNNSLQFVSRDAHLTCIISVKKRRNNCTVIHSWHWIPFPRKVIKLN